MFMLLLGCAVLLSFKESTKRIACNRVADGEGVLNALGRRLFLGGFLRGLASVATGSILVFAPSLDTPLTLPRHTQSDSVRLLFVLSRFKFGDLKWR
jgi:hypothetical protein